MKKRKFNKREVEKFNWSIKYIREELKTDRHILACLGSAGITFNDDVQQFYDYCTFIKAKDITQKMLIHLNFIYKGNLFANVNEEVLL